MTVFEAIMLAINSVGLFISALSVVVSIAAILSNKDKK